MPQSSQASRPTLFTLSELVAPVRAPRKVYQLIIISPSLIKYMLPCSRLETLSLSHEPPVVDPEEAPALGGDGFDFIKLNELVNDPGPSNPFFELVPSPFLSSLLARGLGEFGPPFVCGGDIGCFGLLSESTRGVTFGCVVGAGDNTGGGGSARLAGRSIARDHLDRIAPRSKSPSVPTPAWKAAPRSKPFRREAAGACAA